MTKKLISTLLIGSIVFTLAACGKESNGQQSQNPPLQAQQQEGAPAEPTEASYRSIFQDSVFLGDSITEGLSFHDVLDEANVLAGAGKTAEFALEDIAELTKRNPKHIFIQLGSDDILWPTDDPKAYSLKHYAALIGAIKEKLPQADITLLSVTPVTAEREKEEPRYKNISDYNQGLKELADKEQAGFVDLSPVVANHPDLYDEDGIHFKAEFYPFMLDALKDEVK
ncbi:GDSL-type esterase/lipase family protein [Paenibacillus melissococcoides]|uniref:GDSL-type esterase/lipase family protein n=1 Tax=Paenibacillus melissococcoides TaxID=2912268 RepID=A0ABM9G5I8_9BACL|nr:MULTISPECIES: GDSL-type esterase/lipase family protein [Paenibacillus]MEB9894595.1 GDSL-type esterase/lipase family protein [Bacillus cereus]CAH8247099.1 GDSL-type esterase/lipase family protein [Paenibacillus melissococcoides]CAH8716730.1 GDSL-type esterase/lipase family protein [Paenibacillus melissococcoides]CAH8717693.1 GDSL-type esterase/lipase family protein [Paenibacillus melissococcoides]GIO80989.1 lipase [Paenibacillus dendritiformis]